MPPLVLHAGVPRPVVAAMTDAATSTLRGEVVLRAAGDARVVEELRSHDGDVSLVVVPTSPPLAIEEAWRHGGWAAGLPPSTWVPRVADDHDWEAVVRGLRAAKPDLLVRVVMPGESLDQTLERIQAELPVFAGLSTADLVDDAPGVTEAGLLHRVASSRGPAAASALADLLGELPDDDGAAEGRRILAAWARTRFGDGPPSLDSTGPTTTDGRDHAEELDGLDEAWTPTLSPTVEALLTAMDAATADETRRADDLHRQVAEARAQAARVRSELDRIRGRRSVQTALRLASYAKPLFQLVRGDVGPATGATSPATTPAARPDVVPEVLDGPDTPLVASIVVCVHNARDDVNRCLAAVRQHTDLSTHALIVVDDGSDTPTADLARGVVAEVPGAQLIRHEQARGYTMAATAGIEASSTPFVVLLNSDTVPTVGWLDRLLACASSDARTAVVGPWSNAASWQSVPQLMDDAGGWHLNELADDESPDDVASRLGDGEPLWPTVGLVNGFCYLLRRSAFDAVGGFDTERFPRGYGEEDDLSLRLGAAGYRLRIADDVYVHHAKSRSFTPEGRSKIVAVSKQVLREKHGSRVAEEVDGIRRNEPLVRARTWAAQRIVQPRRTPAPPEVWRDGGPTIAWLQPHLEQVGGIRRAITMSNLMQEWGASPVLVTPDGVPTTWLQIDVPVISVEQATQRDFDLLLVSDPDMVDDAARLSARETVTYHLAAYMVYREENDRLRRFYDPTTRHIANSRWTADHVERYADVRVSGVVPGAVDADIFAPRPVTPTHHVVCYGSGRAHKGTATIVEAARGLDLLKLVDLYTQQGGLSTALASGRVFASGAWHEGFNMPPLEAMACGVPVVMTDDGGSRDYARDGENALVVPVRDARAMRQGIRRLLEDEELRVRLIENGLRTASEFTWQRATHALVELLADSTAVGGPPR